MKKIIFILSISIITILRLVLVYDLPVLANVILGADDALMVKQATTIIDGQWLGTYCGTTLLKGVAFPLFLAICYFMKVNYIVGITILYIIACLTMLFVIRKIIKNEFILFLIYTILLFNPIMFGTEIMQRVYRSSIIPALGLFLIACYTNLFLIRNDGKKTEKAITIIGISIVLPFLWFAREDSIWIVPYIIFMMFAILVSNFNKNFFKTFLLLSIPIFATILIGNAISLKNYKEYGAYTTDNKYYYNKLIKSMKKVKTFDDVERVTFTREKLDRIADVTILNNIMDKFNPLLDAYAKFDGNQTDNEVENGWFGFPLRDALSESGYYMDVYTTNKFFNTLHLEIEDALKNGNLEKEDKKLDKIKFTKDMIKTVLRSTKYVLNYDEIILDVRKSIPYMSSFSESFEKYAKITRNKFIYTKDDSINENGIIVSFAKQDSYLDSIQYKNDIINFIIKIYKKITIPLFSLAIIFYIYSTVKLILTIQSKKYYNVEIWIILSGILGAAFTIICGISLETVQNADVISDLYLCGVYPLILAFTLISVYNGCVQIYKRKNTNK